MTDCKPAGIQHDDCADGATDDHPAGRITLPGRVRSEARILALTGVSSVVGAMGLLTAGCAMVMSVSSDAGPVAP